MGPSQGVLEGQLASLTFCDDDSDDKDDNDDDDNDDKGGSLEGRPLMGLTMGTQRQLTPRVRLNR